MNTYFLGRCDCCKAPGLLRESAFGQRHCPLCAASHEMAPGFIADQLEKGHREVEIAGSTINLRAPLAMQLVARALTMQRREKELRGE